jgi:ribosomal protein S18 acetylase RimI-like enzyme
LFKATRAEWFSRAGLAPAALDALLDQQYLMQSRGYSAQFPDATSLLIEAQGEPVGRLLLHCRPERWHIVDIALLGSHRRRGFGSRAMNAVAAAARAQAVPALMLAVAITNHAARGLYLRLGFVEAEGEAWSAHLMMRLDLTG